ncbi:hypothetical protein [Spirosoma pollinicola]|uniref:Uncharacterized protein n=1 Tax=Spirosoma pollinicola TaxID=2057025 RepID=A0A2K8YVY0_9BACT|nr:hypothetical protein [Spirosoma pollinicola]AUD01792.1 hypothetical protein CWM47_08135 [Spirosoma pollinicola]
MTSTSFETSLYQHLTPFFERHQFLLLPEKKQYRKTTDTGFQHILLCPTFYAHETTLAVRLGCRNEQIEQIAQQFLTSQSISQLDTNTLLISIGQFSDFTIDRFCIHSEDELLSVCEQIEHFFATSGFDFLAASSSLLALDRLLNNQPGQPCLYVFNQMHRYYKGLITARLNHNTHFDALVDTYRHLLLAQTQNRHEQIRFERLISYLHYYSAN